MVMKNNPFLIADTSGLISLTVTTDRNHEPAISAAKPLQVRHNGILVPSEVFAETVNVLGKRLGHRQAHAVASYLSETPLFLIIDSSTETRQAALSRFASLPQRVSYTDAVVMAVAEEYETKAIFGFDEDFQKAGYQIIDEDAEREAAYAVARRPRAPPCLLHDPDHPTAVLQTARAEPAHT
jgi:predicted nucleic acid-binding protein